MVKLAQYIDWPPSEPTAPSTTIASITIAHGVHSDSQVFPQEKQEVFAENAPFLIESKKHADHKHGKTLADLFQSACVRNSQGGTPLSEKSPIVKLRRQIQPINGTRSLSEVDGCIHNPDNPKHVRRKNVSSQKSTVLQLNRETRNFSKAKSKNNQTLKVHRVVIDSFPDAQSAPRSIHVDRKTLSVDIPEEMVGLAWLGAEPSFLTPGRYLYPANAFTLEHIHNEQTGFIKHGNLHRVYIKEGHLGVAWVDGKAVLLGPGVSVHACSTFFHIATDDQMVLEKEFVLGPFRIVTVHANEVGIKFCNRRPGVLYEGRYCLSISKVEVFAGFESLLRRQTNLPGVTGTSSDDIDLQADIYVEWQIKPEDAAAARLANVTDVEGAVCEKLCCAFKLVLLDHKAQSLLESQTDGISLEICREWLELFGEGWMIKIWELDIKNLALSSLALSNFSAL